MKKTHVVLIDDIDGTEAAETVTFALRGASYEIDLSEAHLKEFEEDFAKWIKSGRKITGRRAGGRASRSSRQATDRSSRAGKIREWAQAKGITVNERGRIPAEIVAQFEADQA